MHPALISYGTLGEISSGSGRDPGSISRLSYCLRSSGHE